jgi:hypothetical protein
VEVDSATRTLPPGVLVTGPCDAANQSLENTPGWVGGECVNTLADLAEYLKCCLAVIRGVTSDFPFKGKVGAYQIDASGVPADGVELVALRVAQTANANVHRWLDHHAASLPGRPRQAIVSDWGQGEMQLSALLQWVSINSENNGSSGGTQAPAPTSSIRQPLEDSPIHDGQLMLSCAEIARRFDVPLEVLRSRLRRWQSKNQAGWKEVANPRPREPRYLYRLSAVMPIIRDVSATVQTPGEKNSNHG